MKAPHSITTGVIAGLTAVAAVNILALLPMPVIAVTNDEAALALVIVLPKRVTVPAPTAGIDSGRVPQEGA